MENNQFPEQEEERFLPEEFPFYPEPEISEDISR